MKILNKDTKPRLANQQYLVLDLNIHYLHKLPTIVAKTTSEHPILLKVIIKTIL